ANDTQRVDVWEANGCGYKTNGVMSVRTTPHWLTELRQYTTRRASPLVYAYPPSDLRSVKWSEASLPAEVCGGSGVIHLHDGQAETSSARWPRYPQVHVSLFQRVTFGDIDGDGRVEALVSIWCDTGGGTGSGLLGTSIAVL